MYRLLLTAVMLVGILSGFVQGGTHASFTSSAGSTNNFTAGTLTLAADEANSTSLTLSNLTPGDSIIADITVQNSGDLDLRYAMQTPVTTATGAALTMFDALTADVWWETMPVSPPSNYCATTYATDVPANLLYSGPLSAAAFGLSATNNANRPLDANSGSTNPTSELLCIRVTLPSSEGTSDAGLTALVDYRFVAFQAAGTGSTGTP